MRGGRQKRRAIHKRARGVPPPRTETARSRMPRHARIGRTRARQRFAVEEPAGVPPPSALPNAGRSGAGGGGLALDPSRETAARALTRLGVSPRIERPASWVLVTGKLPANARIPRSVRTLARRRATAQVGIHQRFLGVTCVGRSRRRIYAASRPWLPPKYWPLRPMNDHFSVASRVTIASASSRLAARAGSRSRRRAAGPSPRRAHRLSCSASTGAIAPLGVALGSLLARSARRDRALQLTHRPAALDRAPGELTAPRGVGLAQQALAVALGQPPGVEQVQHLVGQVEQPQRVRRVRAAAADPPGQRRLRESEVVDQRAQRPRLLDRREVLAGRVLDQRQLECEASSVSSRMKPATRPDPRAAAARQRRSPATSSKSLVFEGRTSTGCSTPRSRIDAASA